MNRGFTLGTELTEEDVGGGRPVSASQASATGGSELNRDATTNGGWGLVFAAIALWAVWWLFPGNERPPLSNPPRPTPTEAQTAPPPETRKPSGITVELGPSGIVVRDNSTPASGAGKATHKAAPAASPPARSRAASASSAALDQ